MPVPAARRAPWRDWRDPTGSSWNTWHCTSATAQKCTGSAWRIRVVGAAAAAAETEGLETVALEGEGESSASVGDEARRQAMSRLWCRAPIVIVSTSTFARVSRLDRDEVVRTLTGTAGHSGQKVWEACEFGQPRKSLAISLAHCTHCMATLLMETCADTQVNVCTTARCTARSVGLRVPVQSRQSAWAWALEQRTVLMLPSGSHE